MIAVLILGGDFFLATAVANNLTKLCLKLKEMEIDPSIKNSVLAEILSMIVGFLVLGQEGKVKADSDSIESFYTCIKVLTNPSSEIR